MYVSQPPPKQMEFWASCCDHGWHRRPVPPRETIENNTGLTVGDLYDRAKEVIAKHRRCPQALEYGHVEDTGEVRVGVCFAAEVELDAEDPVLEQKKQFVKKSDDRNNARSSWTTRLGAYTAAKQAAAANGTSIPTLEEFEASRRQTSV